MQHFSPPLCKQPSKRSHVDFCLDVNDDMAFCIISETIPLLAVLGAFCTAFPYIRSKKYIRENSIVVNVLIVILLEKSFAIDDFPNLFVQE